METDRQKRAAILVFALLQAETLSIDAEMRFGVLQFKAVFVNVSRTA
jgi:hypothetical protein